VSTSSCSSADHDATAPALRLLLGSTSDHLARHTRAPLVIAPPHDDAAVARWRERQAAHIA
jgi:hypothetical protein